MPVLAATVTRVPSDDLARFVGQVAPLFATTPAWATGVVTLTTCQRFEVYLEVADVTEPTRLLTAAIGAAAPGLPAHRVAVRTGPAAAGHLFRVAAGLDSVVVGEAEIAGQVRRALGAAEHASPALRRLFQDALRASKAVAAGTGLGGVGRSVAAAGLDLIAARRGEQSRREAGVVLLGTGSYAGVVVAELARRGLGPVRVFSAAGRAAAFAASHGIEWVGPDEIGPALGAAGLVVTCSGTGGLDPAAWTEAARMALLAGRVLPVLDLALGGEVVPRDGLDVVGLDAIAAHAPAGQEAEVAAAAALVERQLRRHLDAEARRAATPAVVAVRRHVEDIVAGELAEAERRLPPEAARAVRESLRRVTGSLLHHPSVRGADAARAGDLAQYVNAVRTVFGIEVAV